MQRVRSYAVNRFRRHCLQVWTSRGGGFYGFVALLTFLYLEVVDLAGDIAALPGSHADLGFVISWIVGNLVDAFVNSIRAAIWPLSWLEHFGVGILSGALLAGSYLAYRAVRPTVIRWLAAPAGEAEAIPVLETPLA